MGIKDNEQEDVIDTEGYKVEEVETEEVEAEAVEGEGDEQEEEVEEVVVTIGDEAPPETEEHHAPEWVRELRKNYRELQKEKRELEDKLRASAPAVEKPTVGKKPSLDDFDYDTEKYEAELTAWYERKRKSEAAEESARAAEEESRKAWQQKLDAYGKSKTELKVKDFDDAEDVAKDSFSVTQQGIVLQGAENPALVIYAVGKNPKKAKELAAISDPVKFAFAVAKLEAQLKVTNRKAPPPPEKPVQGTGRPSGSVDSTLERLRSDAEKTGDYSKVLAYKRQKRA